MNTRQWNAGVGRDYAEWMGVLVRRLVTGVMVAAVLGGLGAHPAAAQPTDAPSSDPADEPEEAPEGAEDEAPAPTESPELGASKEAFTKAQQVRKESGCERAVPLYLRSRELNPALSNTLNAALCLEKLERGDEALALYEALLSEQGDQLSPKLRATVTASLERLRGMVGQLTVTGVEGAVVVIDGRRRGTLPLAEPVPVLGGTRAVQVVKDGHEPFVTAVDVVVSETVTVDAVTPLLTQSGGLEVALPELEGAEIWLDGAPVGHVPWSGKLAPGRYLLQVMQWDRGTAPRQVVIVAGQTARLDLQATTLGPEVTVVTDPPGATLTLGDEDTALGESLWRGRLPLGEWRFRARQEGYADGVATFDSRADGRAERLTLALAVDEDHPRWAMGKAPSFRFVLAALGGPSDRLGDAFVRGSCDPTTDATAVACAPGQALFEGEALYDPMVMVMPMAQAGYRFE